MPTRIEWRGLVVGGDPYRGRKLDGWEDLPTLDSGDVERPVRHGAWAGTSYAQARTVTLNGLIRCPRGELVDRVRELRRACAVPTDDTLYPLTITAMGETLTAQARVSQRIITLTKDVPLGHAPFTLQWTCPDPTRYEPDPVQLAIPPGGYRVAPHHGDVATRPLVTVYGPCTGPVLRRAGTPDIVLGFDLEVLAGETLAIDCRAGTATLDGVDALAALTSDSVPVEYWTIPADSQTPIHFEVATSGAPARAWVRYQHAHL